MTYYLLFILHLFSTREMMLDKKQIWAIFLFKFKTGCKAAETTCNISNTFGPETANEHTGQRWLEKFCERDESLEDEQPSSRPWKLRTTNWELSSKLILFQLHKSLPKISVSTSLRSFSIWSKLERWKSSMSGCLVTWPQIKNIVLKCYLLLCYATATDHFLIRLWHVMKSGFCMTTSDDQLSG